jgi:septum site-determining protein MinD
LGIAISDSQRKGRGRKISIRPRRGVVIGVFSAKGGVGKTTTVSNLTAALGQKFRGKVIAVDCNLSAPNLGLHFGITEPKYTIHDFLANGASLVEVIRPLEWGAHAIPGALELDRELYPPDFSNLIQQLKGLYKLILLDTAPGLGAEVQAAMRVCDVMLIVTTPKIPEVASTLKTFRMVERLGGRVIGVMVNMQKGGKFEIPLSSMRKTFAWPILSTVPYDPKVDESTATCVPVVKYAPNSPAARAFKRTADLLLKKIGTANKQLTRAAKRTRKRGKK